MKSFTTEGVCIPSENYMVDLSSRMVEIRKLIDDGKYFTINRARQYGKTTTLAALEKYLAPSYDVISLDFQDVTDDMFENEAKFTRGLSQVICDTADAMELPVPEAFYGKLAELAETDKETNLSDLFRVFDSWCRMNDKPIVLIIDGYYSRLTVQ